MPWRIEDREKFIRENPNYQKEYYKKYQYKKIKYQHEYENKNKEVLKIKYKNRWQKRKKEYDNIMKELKINGCAICGYNECRESLDFHHTNPKDKLFKINKRTLDWSIEKMVDELNKCILLCKNCHYELHYKEKKKMEREKMNKEIKRGDDLSLN